MINNTDGLGLYSTVWGHGVMGSWSLLPVQQEDLALLELGTKLRSDALPVTSTWQV